MNRYAEFFVNVAHYIRVVAHGAHYCDVSRQFWDSNWTRPLPNDKEKKAVWPCETRFTVLLNALIQAKLLDLCTLNLKSLFHQSIKKTNKNS